MNIVNGIMQKNIEEINESFDIRIKISCENDKRNGKGKKNCYAAFPVLNVYTLLRWFCYINHIY